MLCFRCGSPVGDDATQCDNCGQDLTVDQSTVRPLPKVPSSPGEDTSAARAQRMQSGVAAAAEFAALQKKLRRQTNPGFGIADNRPSAYNVGEVVCERYEITDVIGGGGLGMVYKALDQEVEVDVALKVIDGDYLPDAAARERFLGEMQRLRELVHGNVVRYFDVDEDDGRCFYVTQFLEGLSLRKIMDLRREKSQRFSVDEVEPIITQLCQALEESAPIVHGGLKPQNIIILPDVLKLTDFGLPQALPRSAYMAAQRQHEGSVSYLAPELAGGDDPTPMSDVYSLGALIYELLSGDRYVGGAPALSVDDPSIPPAIDALLAQALADDPDARQGSAGELARHWLVATG